MLSKYNSFIEDMILENLINESFLYLSPNVRKVLGRLFARNHNDIAGEILSSEGTDVKPDMTFIDLGKEGYLSFITMKNAKPLIVDKYPNLDWSQNIDNVAMPDPKLYTNDLYEFDINKNKDSTGVFLKSRNEVGLGKFVNKLFPDKYSSKQIEKFVNLFKSALEKSDEYFDLVAGEYFDLVEGEDIEKWYNYENYKDMSGTLGNSCMAQRSGIFEIYVQNQDVCKMLVLIEDDKLIGRAIVWKLDSIRRGRDMIEGVKYFMDRQYTIKESDVEKFRDYARSQPEWCYKSYNNHHSCGTVTINNEEINVNMTVKLANKHYRRYPYMDTFRKYDPSDGTLYNDDDDDTDRYQGYYILDDSNGGYTEIEEEDRVYSEWFDEHLNADDAVWSNRIDDYIPIDRAVLVNRGSRGNRGWYPNDHDDIFYDNYLEEYIHVEDGVYSSIEDEHLYIDSAVLVIDEVFDNGDVNPIEDQYMNEDDSDLVSIDTSSLWYEKISDKFRDWKDYNYILKSLMIYDYEENLIPKKLSTKIYKIVEVDDVDAIDITGIEYLDEIDAKALGYKVNKEDKRIIDWFTYTDNISEFLEILTDRVSKLFKKYKDILNNKGQLRIPFNDDEYFNNVREIYNQILNRKEDLENEEWN